MQFSERDNRILYEVFNEKACRFHCYFRKFPQGLINSFVNRTCIVSFANNRIEVQDIKEPSRNYSYGVSDNGTEFGYTEKFNGRTVKNLYVEKRGEHQFIFQMLWFPPTKVDRWKFCESLNFYDGFITEVGHS